MVLAPASCFTNVTLAHGEYEFSDVMSLLSPQCQNMTYNDIYLSTVQLNRVLTELLYESFCSGKNNVTFVMLGV